MAGITQVNNVTAFDESPGYDEEETVKVAAGLSEEEREQAKLLYKLFQGLWGLCIVIGDPGTGKDLFGNILSYLMKRYFPWKRIMRDEKPREAFGGYAGEFNETVLSEELKKMREIAQGIKGEVAGMAMEKAADAWVAKAGVVKLKDSVLYLADLWRYCSNREPHNPMNKTMGGIHKQTRHMDCLIIGTVQEPEDLDKKTCLRWVKWVVICNRSQANKTGFIYHVQPVRYDKRMGQFIHLGEPTALSFDAGEPMRYLGDGLIRITRPEYEPQDENERVVMEALRQGYNTYEGLVEILGEHSKMDEWEVLETVKGLKYWKHKRAIDYNDWFRVYNSKSVPNQKTSLKGEA